MVRTQTKWSGNIVHVSKNGKTCDLNDVILYKIHCFRNLRYCFASLKNNSIPINYYMSQGGFGLMRTRAPTQINHTHTQIYIESLWGYSSIMPNDFFCVNPYTTNCLPNYLPI